MSEPAPQKADRMRGMMMPPSGVLREVFLNELFHITGELMRLLDCHVEGIAPTGGPIVVLKSDKMPVEGNEVGDAEIGIPAENAAPLEVLEHEVSLKMVFESGKLKKASLVSDGKPIWGYTGRSGQRKEEVKP